jgi:heme exporter protein C
MGHPGLSAVEVGFVLALINVVLVSIWARPTWNTWWTGDSRMVASAIMMLIGLAYPLLRKGVANPERRRVVGAIVSFLLMAAMVYTTLTTRLRADTSRWCSAQTRRTHRSAHLTDSMRIAL